MDEVFFIALLLITFTSICSSMPVNVEHSLFNCYFQIDTCTWTQATDDDFDWIRHRGPTLNHETGPSDDPTKQNRYYMYIEAANVRIGKKARLVSMQAKANQEYCLLFWYIMNGEAVNELNVYLKINGSLGKPVWTKSGNQGKKWFDVIHQIPKQNEPFNIVFEAIRGYSYLSDIGLDDIKVAPRLCRARYAVLVYPRLGCDFENDTCLWTQATDDQFDWTRSNGPTSSSNTGPTTDHTKQHSSGYYMYIEASSPRHPGDKARLVSVAAKANHEYCLHFWYHMYGDFVGQLNVYLMINGNLGKPVWSEAGNQNDTWLYAMHPIPKQKSPFNIVFEGVREDSYLSDIGLDDIKVTFNGLCPPTPVRSTTESGPSTSMATVSTFGPTTAKQATVSPTTAKQTAASPITIKQTTVSPTTLKQTTVSPTTLKQTTVSPTAVNPTTYKPATSKSIKTTPFPLYIYVPGLTG